MTGQGGFTDLPWPCEKDHFFVKVHADRCFKIAAQIHDPNCTRKPKKVQLILLTGKKSTHQKAEDQREEFLPFVKGGYGLINKLFKK